MRSALSFQTSIFTIWPSCTTKTIDVAIALERGAVDPLAVQRADAVDHGLAGAGTNVEPVHLLLHPAIALRIEAGRSARMIEGAPAVKVITVPGFM